MCLLVCVHVYEGMYPIRCHSDSKWPFKVVSIGEIRSDSINVMERGRGKGEGERVRLVDTTEG